MLRAERLDELLANVSLLFENSWVSELRGSLSACLGPEGEHDARNEVVLECVFFSMMKFITLLLLLRK